MPKLGFALRALKHRNYRLFFGGQLISLIGTWMQNVAQAWLVYRLTGSAAPAGAGRLRGTDPRLPARPVGGTAADRWNRRRIVIAHPDRVHAAGLHTGGAYADRPRHRSGTSSCLRRCWAWSTPSTSRRGRPSSWTWWARPDLDATPSRSTPPCSTARASSARPSRACWWPPSARAGASSPTA